MVWRMGFLVSFPWVGEGWAGEHGAWNGDHGSTYTVARPQAEKQGVVWTRQTGNVKQSWAQELVELGKGSQPLVEGVPRRGRILCSIHPSIRRWQTLCCRWKASRH